METTKFTALMITGAVIAGSLAAMVVPTEMRTRSHWSGREEAPPPTSRATYRLVESGPVDLSPDYHRLAALDDPIAPGWSQVDPGDGRTMADEPGAPALQDRDHLMPVSDLVSAGAGSESFVPPMPLPAATALVKATPPTSAGGRPEAIIRLVRAPEVPMENTAETGSVTSAEARAEIASDSDVATARLPRSRQDPDF